MASSSTNKTSANASSSTPSGRRKWTFEQYMQVRIIAWETASVRGLISDEIIPDIFAELNSDAKRFPVSNLVDHRTKNEDTNQAKAMHQAWRTCGWKGVPYTEADKELMVEIREAIRETAAYKKYRAEQLAKTGDKGEDVGELEGGEAENEE
ncbi:hypothetical protein CLAFUW4_10735 [Fulvia fulva]|uniref:uncharacterized protein n=1 Tax=Passalora fulva TaxID=5499 RepID=UPI002852829F|nr:uncharacterized protein CLAFUR5_20300 [Fulvia fulva]KAK4615948.1 hypothetical protein CLAFUR4_10740 [Fulvia fulva]KAK4617062.1 hypothetical protein CLAFUR0_10747 [Fulvia fulva]WMI38885.1 hypothetical protein CLAFUR5_20300 [Fulvia fulva]WPV19386.1 hypothetical protein CLAFUW4_10735 [Fulvia fulva]WPV34368.1 hypothetical protein CLAFUW7_10737 [Fulvia fulva]